MAFPDPEPTRPLFQIGWRPYQSARDWLQRAGLQSGRLVDDCSQILLAAELSALSLFSSEDREVACQRIQACQDAESGLIVAHPDEARQTDLRGASTSQLFSTSLALLALEALGEKALHPLHFLDRLEAPGALSDWLDSLDWKQAALASEQVMYTLLAFIYQGEVDARSSAPPHYHHVLDWLEQTQDPKTGLWGIKDGASLHQAVIAGYHLVPFFEYVHRPVMRVSHILDAAIHLQAASGSLFFADPVGFYTGLAASSLLAMFTPRYPYRRPEIRSVLAASARDILDRQANESVFLPLSGEPNQPADAAGWLVAEFSRNASLQIRMHLAVLAAAAHAGLEGLPAGWASPHWPTIGWLRSQAVLDDRMRAVLPLWLKRPTCRALSDDQEELPGEADPAVSVVIPCYNLGAYLYQAVDSVFAQTFQDFELIVIDDGSTDEFTRLAIDNLDCPKTRVLRQENRGLPAARNAGIRLARGRYICCLDADDRLRPGYFAAAVPILDSQPDIGFVTGHLEMFDERQEIYRGGDCALPELLVQNHVIVPALFRRAAWSTVGGFCETFSSSGIEDWDFWISLLEAGYPAWVIPEVLYDYRFRSDAMSVGMYVPQTWGRLYRELVDRHPASYQKHFAEVLDLQATRWVLIRQWALDQERAVAWWERQSGIWQHQAQSRELLALQGQQRVHALEQEAALQAQVRHDTRPSKPKGRLEQAWIWLGKLMGYIEPDPGGEETWRD